jgi:hypothetical protein
MPENSDTDASGEHMPTAIALQTLYNERGDFLFAMTPTIVDSASSTPGPLIFPQVVSGGGFTTEFILMNSAGQPQGTLTLTSKNGLDLPLFEQ